VISLVFAICLSAGVYPIVASHYGVTSPSWLMAKELKLGLDLRGGVHLVLRVRTDEVLCGETESAVARLLESLKEKQVTFGHVARTDSTHFAVDGIAAGADAANAADVAFRDALADVSFDRGPGINVMNGSSYTFVMKPAVQAALRANAITQTRETIERRVNELGVSEAGISPRGANGDELLVELPGVGDIDRARAIIQSQGRLELKIVEQGPAASPEALTAGHVVPDGMEIVAHAPEASRTGSPGYYLVKTAAGITGSDLRTARSSLGDTGRPEVDFTLTGAHISGLIAAACLFAFGTGPIQGFAVTLTIGLVSNLFTSTFVSRWLFDLALARHP
jgi:preprotein translocase subunit SecD